MAEFYNYEVTSKICDVEYPDYVWVNSTSYNVDPETQEGITIDEVSVLESDNNRFMTFIKKNNLLVSEL